MIQKEIRLKARTRGFHLVDDLPAHIKSSLLSANVMIPVTNGIDADGRGEPSP